MRSRSTALVCFLLVAMFGVASTGFAYDAKQIDARVVKGLENWDKAVANSKEIIAKAEGILVCPKITKVGLGVGAERGSCALMVDGKTVEYWRASAASIGLTAGVQTTGSVMAFMTPEALAKFRDSDRGWEAGVDGSIVVAKKGASGSMSTTEMNQPIMGWIYTSQGLMADLSFKGATFKRIGTEADVAKFADPFHRFVVTAELSDSSSPSTGGAQTIQMTIEIDNWVTIAEIEAMQALIRDKGTAEASMAITEMPRVGTIKHGGKTVPIQWARALQMGDRYRVLLATSEPMGFSWAKQAENSLTIFQLDLDSNRLGSGVLQMDPELGWDDNRNGITVQQKNIKPVRLTSVSYKKID